MGPKEPDVTASSSVKHRSKANLMPVNCTHNAMLLGQQHGATAMKHCAWLAARVALPHRSPLLLQGSDCQHRPQESKPCVCGSSSMLKLCLTSCTSGVAGTAGRFLAASSYAFKLSCFRRAAWEAKSPEADAAPNRPAPQALHSDIACHTQT